MTSADTGFDFQKRRSASNRLKLADFQNQLWRGLNQWMANWVDAKTPQKRLGLRSKSPGLNS
jgi:hypothetical protein